MPLTTNIRFAEFRTAFEIGIHKVHRLTLETLPRSYAVWLSEKRADEFYATDWGVTGLGVMPAKGIGQNFLTDQLIQAPKKTYQLVTYGLALVIQHEAERWDLYGIFAPLAKELARSAVDRYNLVAYSIWQQAFSPDASTGTLYQTFQQEPLVKLAHTRLDGGTWKNRPTTNLGLSYVALQQGIIDLRKLVDDRGRYVQVSPEKLLTSVEQEWIAEEILTSKWRPDNNAQNVNTLSKHKLECVVSPYITLTQSYFLLCDKDKYDIQMTLGEDPDFETENRPATRDRIYSSYCSFRLDIYNSQGIWGSSGDGTASP